MNKILFLSFFVCIFVTVKHRATRLLMAQEIIKTVVENKVSESDALINKMKEKNTFHIVF